MPHPVSIALHAQELKATAAQNKRNFMLVVNRVTGKMDNDASSADQGAGSASLSRVPRVAKRPARFMDAGL